MTSTRLYWLHTLSPTHVGTGRGVGYIDLPIDRDGITDWPIIRGSGFKGVWRDYAVREQLSNIDDAFGRADKDGELANSGALMPTDAQLVCLPVRSFRGTFAWATSPLCLQMLRRTLTLAGFKELPDVPKQLAEQTAHHPESTVLLDEGYIYLEDLDFQGMLCATATAWATFIANRVFASDDNWQAQFRSRFVVLPDDEFDFLCTTGTEVHTRVRIDDEQKVVAKGALWTEESLPAETILLGLVQCDRVFRSQGEANQKLTPETLLDTFAPIEPQVPLMLQIGGKATVGRGRVRCVFSSVNGDRP